MFALNNVIYLLFVISLIYLYFYCVPFEDGSALFHAFLTREFCEENIEFWMACEDFKKVKPNKMSSKAKKIYDDFLAVKAPKEVSILIINSKIYFYFEIKLFHHDYITLKLLSNRTKIP